MTKKKNRILYLDARLTKWKKLTFIVFKPRNKMTKSKNCVQQKDDPRTRNIHQVNEVRTRRRERARLRRERERERERER